MIEITKVKVYNFDNAIRGAQNPMSSWERIDSYFGDDGEYVIGANDLALASKLCRAGSDHRKFMRQILLTADICAPLYWWKEFDEHHAQNTFQAV